MFVFQLLINYLTPRCPLLFLGLKSAKMFMEIDHMFAKLELLSFIKSFLKNNLFVRRDYVNYG
jgi:hypothetical protein